MTDQERKEYEDLQDYFLQRQGEVNSKSKRDRLNKLGKKSVENRRTYRLVDGYITDTYWTDTTWEE